jgi:hypothetical protein
MSEQPEALRLADFIFDKPDSDGHCMKAAAELRRLHALCEEMHIQRGAVPEGWQLVPKELTPEMLAGGLGYWLNVMAPGKQRDTAAKEYTAMLAAAPAPSCTAPAPAEVLMPKPVAYGIGNTAITGHTNRLMMVRIDIPGGDQYAGAFWLPLVLADEAHIYGIAREAAGYARAANWLRTCAEKHAEENGYHEPDTGAFVFAGRAAEEWNNSVLELADEMEAALRGEVKPAEQVAAEFKADLHTLLDKFCAELTAKDHWGGYPECGEDIRMTVTVPAIYDADHNCLREFTEIDLGSYVAAASGGVKS